MPKKERQEMLGRTGVNVLLEIARTLIKQGGAIWSL